LEQSSGSGLRKPQVVRSIRIAGSKPFAHFETAYATPPPQGSYRFATTPRRLEFIEPVHRPFIPHREPFDISVPRSLSAGLGCRLWLVGMLSSLAQVGHLHGYAIEPVFFILGIRGIMLKGHAAAVWQDTYV
jgi:hypothetical protein